MRWVERVRAKSVPHERRVVARDFTEFFRQTPLERYRWAYRHLAHVQGPHLDLGCNVGGFTSALATGSNRWTVGVDVPGVELPSAHQAAELVTANLDSGLPFVASSFASVSLLDVLEHVADDVSLLIEARRVLCPGGVLVVTVPAQHRWSILDPDDALFRFPRLHRLAWSLRFGRLGYAKRFTINDRGVIGDIAAVRRGHTNYRVPDLSDRVQSAGFRIDRIYTSGRWFRWWQLGSLMLPGGLGRLFDAGLRRDGQRSTYELSPNETQSRGGNLFVLATALG